MNICDRLSLPIEALTGPGSRVNCELNQGIPSSPKWPPTLYL